MSEEAGHTNAMFLHEGNKVSLREQLWWARLSVYHLYGRWLKLRPSFIDWDYLRHKHTYTQMNTNAVVQDFHELRWQSFISTNNSFF